MDSNDYYQLLGVARDASEKDIRAAFRQLAHEFRPDLRPGDAWAEENFKTINEAYRALSVPDTRRQYDALGVTWQRLQKSSGWSSGFDFVCWASGPDRA